jgi:peptidoglycan/LPS O-acetylase OafA/YrhL
VRDCGFEVIASELKNLCGEKRTMRKYFVDNIRWLCILMLFPYHIFRIYNSFMMDFYVEGQDVVLTTGFIVATTPWFMPLLFVLAGISSAHALNKITNKEYIKERMYKLLIPLVVGILLVIPAQTYFAERFHNDFTGGYFYQYILFFTSPTDLTGYRGGFTPAHLWFILYLFVISIVALPIMTIYKNSKRKLAPDKISVWALPPLFILPLLMTPILNFSGLSVGRYFAFFLLGYLILSSDTIINKLSRVRLLMSVILVVLMVLHVGAWLLSLYGIFELSEIAVYAFSIFYGWFAILTVLGLGNHYLNFRNRGTDYLSASSFPVYIFHQTWIVVVAYYILSAIESISLQMILILISSFLLTYATYELCRRIPGIRFLFGIKARSK